MNVRVGTVYTFECYQDERLLWREQVPNIVVTAGLNKLLDATFKTGLATPTWYVGLVDNAGWTAFSAADVMSAHGGWTEAVPYSDAARPTLTLGTISAGSVSNSAAKATYNINATATLKGAFLADNSTKSGTTGTLYGEAAFPSTRAVSAGNVLRVTLTLSAATA